MTLSIKNTTALLLIILILLTALTYANTLHNGFVWDDNDIIVNNTVNRNLSNITTLFKSADVVYSDDQRAYYRPLNRLTYMLDYQLFGLNPVGYHVENLMLHILSVIAFFFVVQKVAGRRSVAFGTALLFALHPVNSEAVNFLSGGRNTILATLFTLLAFLAWERGKETGLDRYRWLSGGLFFLGLLSKETALMLLPFLAIREIKTKGSRKNLFLICWNFIPFAFSALVYLTLRTAALSGVMGEQPFPPGFWTRLLQQVYIIPQYALNILLPVKLCSYYTLPRDFQEHLPLLLTFWIMLAIVIALLLKSKRPATRFGLLWLAVNFIPIAQIIPIPSAPMADRYLYLPAIGIWLIIADSIAAMGEARGDAMSNRPLKLCLAGAAVCICAVLSVLTWRNNRTWKDDITLNVAILKVEPDSVFAHYNLGGAYKTLGDLDSAARAWEHTVQLDPKHSHALNQLGTHHLLKGRPAEALTYFTRAIAANPNNAVPHYNRAMVLEGLGRTGEAVEEYQNFLSIIPDEHVTLIPDIKARITRLRQSPRKEVR